MEPDFNTIIQKKTRNAELKNLPWHRDETWERIRGEIGPSKRIRRRYLIAASLIPILVSLFWGLRYYQSKQLSNKIEMIAEAIEKYKADQDPINTAKTDMQLPCIKEIEAGEKLSDPIISAIHKNKNVYVEAGDRSEVSPGPIPKSTLEPEMKAPEPLQITLDDVAPEILIVRSEKVRPIIGVFDDTEMKLQIPNIEKKAKLRFRKSNVNDVAAGLNGEDKVVIARIH